MDDKKSAVNAAEKGKALAAALAQIEKQFGKGSVMRMDINAPVEEVQTVSTGSLGLDIALGVGGLPRGRIAAPVPSSTPSTRWTSAMRRSWASSWTSC
jgi:recombination protein RecA